MPEWIESWDLEAMTSYTSRLGFAARSAQVGWSFFTRGSHPRFFSTEISRMCLRDMRISVPTPSSLCSHKRPLA